MKKRTFIIITILLILAAVAAILWQTGVFAKIKNKVTDSDNSGSGTSSGSGSGTSTARNDNFPLKKGSYGKNVETLQTILNKYIKNYAKNGLSQFKYNGKVETSLVVDGDFGVRTNAALIWATGYDYVSSQTALNNLNAMVVT